MVERLDNDSEKVEVLLKSQQEEITKHESKLTELSEALKKETESNETKNKSRNHEVLQINANIMHQRK